MLNADDIENDRYSTNDIADLLMRLQTASTALSFVADNINRANVHNDFIKEAHEVALNTWGRLQLDHDCAVELGKNGVYRCKCNLIASAE